MGLLAEREHLSLKIELSSLLFCSETYGSLRHTFGTVSGAGQKVEKRQGGNLSYGSMSNQKLKRN